MNQKTLIVALILGLGSSLTPSFSCSDEGCNFQLSFLEAPQNSVCSNLPFITPYNDNRVNLLLLQENQTLLSESYDDLTLPYTEASYHAEEDAHALATIPFSIDRWRDDASALAESERQITNIIDGINIHAENLIKAIETHDLELNKRTLNFAKIVANNTKNKDFIPVLEFIHALSLDHNLSVQEQAELATVRIAYFQDQSVSLDALIKKNSQRMRPYLEYLQGMSKFYLDDYAGARDHFIAAQKQASAWIKETGSYMIGRTLLREAQASGLDEWGGFEHSLVDRDKVVASLHAFNAYLADYPEGRYSDSARGLLRRLAWLQGNQTALIEQYAALLKHPETYADYSATRKQGSIAGLVFEIERALGFDHYYKKINPHDYQSEPDLLFIALLTQMRGGEEALPLATLESMQPYFSQAPHFYNFLIASYYTYSEPLPFKVLTTVPPLVEEGEITSLILSQQIMRALAFENAEDWLQAEAVWRTLLTKAPLKAQQELIQLGLALHYEKSGQVAKVFAQDSPITVKQFRYILINKRADRALLQSLIHDTGYPQKERAEIGYTLLHNDLTTQNYLYFLEDYVNLPQDLKTQPLLKDKTIQAVFDQPVIGPANYRCLSPEKHAQRLVDNPDDGQSLNCLGLFMRHHAETPFSRYSPEYTSYVPYEPVLSFTSLGNARTATAETPRLGEFGFYKKVIDNAEASANDRAYALSQALNCFKSVGYNRCDTTKIAKDERKRWFNLLKSKYKKTPWAIEQKYYW